MTTDSNTVHTFEIAGRQRSSLIVHCNRVKYNRKTFRPVKNSNFTKPYSGGLWTCPIDTNYNWKNCDAASLFDTSIESYLRLKKDCKIFVINSEKDLSKLMIYYGLDKGIDFEKLSLHYDALWLTSIGETKTKFTRPYNLYGWDCETVLVLNNRCFTITNEVTS